MKRKTATRSALFTSIISLLLCVSMLVGTTFAWFTDSVASGNNVIASGNLDIELEYYDGSNWQTVKDATDLFSGALWEPGHTQVVYLKLSNLGTLALKYNLGINIVSETEGTRVNADTGADESFKLSDYIHMGVVEGAQPSYTSREEAIDAAMNGANGIIGAGYTKSGSMLGKTTDAAVEEYLAVVVYMPETIGNEANYKTGTTPPVINLGITVAAIQKDAETDSFGPDYDEGLDPATTYLVSGADLHQSTASSGNFGLSNHIQTSLNGDDARYGWGYEYIIRKGADYTLDLNGKNIIHDTVNKNANHNAFTYLFVANNPGTKLTINGEGKIYSNNSEGYTCALQGKDGTKFTINGGDYQVDNGIAVWAGAGSHMIINGGSFVNGNATTDHELIYSSGGVIDIYGGFFHNTDGNYTLNVEDRNRATGFINVYGGTFVNFDPSTGGQDPNNIKVADGYSVVAKTQANGDVWYTVVKDAYKEFVPAHSVDDVLDAVENGETEIILAEDLVSAEGDNALIESSGELSIEGNGTTITSAGNDKTNGYVGFIPAVGEDATVNNVTVEGSGFVEVGHYGQGGGNYEVNNLVIKNFEATLTVVDGTNAVAAAFAHYGTAVLNGCTLTGTTVADENYVAYDMGCVNKTTTTINNSAIGSMYIWSQAHVNIGAGTNVDKIVSAAITTRNLGMLTIEAGASVGTIELVPAGTYPPALTIEEGATVGAIIYNGVTYTVAEWLAR